MSCRCGSTCCSGKRGHGAYTGAAGLLSDVPIHDDATPDWAAPYTGPPRVVEADEPRPAVAGRTWVQLANGTWASIPSGAPAAAFQPPSSPPGRSYKAGYFDAAVELYAPWNRPLAIAGALAEGGKIVGLTAVSPIAGVAGGVVGGAAGTAVRTTGEAFIDAVTKRGAGDDAGGGKRPPPNQLPKWAVPAAVGGVLLLLLLRR